MDPAATAQGAYPTDRAAAAQDGQGAEWHMDPAANEHGAYAIGDAAGEHVVHVWSRHTGRNPGHPERSEAIAAEWLEPQSRRPEQQRSTTKTRDDASVAAGSAR